MSLRVGPINVDEIIPPLRKAFIRCLCVNAQQPFSDRRKESQISLQHMTLQCCISLIIASRLDWIPLNISLILLPCGDIYRVYEEKFNFGTLVKGAEL